MPKIEILPSLLAADLGELASAARLAEQAGSGMLHLDIMDGHFVNNLSMGAGVVKMASETVDLPLHVHLMIMKPGEYLDQFAAAGADTILIHTEARCDCRVLLTRIRELGIRAGVVLNPETPVEMAYPFVDEGLTDEVLFMSVHPGFGEQSYLKYVEPKITALRERAGWLDISIDGGINDQSIVSAAAAGANLFVAGSFLFKASNMSETVQSLTEKATAASKAKSHSH